jgi:hypothetical protein
LFRCPRPYLFGDADTLSDSGVLEDPFPERCAHFPVPPVRTHVPSARVTGLPSGPGAVLIVPSNE